MSLPGPGIVCLESESYDMAALDGAIASDDLIHKPGIGRIERIRCHRRIGTPLFRVVGTRTVESGASDSIRPRRDRVNRNLASRGFSFITGRGSA
jgi:hypothetical protein